MSFPFTVRAKSAAEDVLKQREAIFDQLEKATENSLQPFRDVSVSKYRQMRRDGTNGFPKPPLLPTAENITIKSRDGADLTLRIIRPSTSESTGSLLHYHAGGLVYGSSDEQDHYLQGLANGLQLTAISVEYRLAPENQGPTIQNDASDAALFVLSSDSEARIKAGGPLRILAGDSAGAYLAVCATLSLRDNFNIDVRASIMGLLLSYGQFDLSGTPSLLTHKNNVIVSRESLVQYVDAAFPPQVFPDRKAPTVSPLYADLNDLPPALFLCGSRDPVVDDSVFMGARWALAGSRAEIVLVEGGFHGFSLIPTGEIQNEGIGELLRFGQELLR